VQAAAYRRRVQRHVMGPRRDSPRLGMRDGPPPLVGGPKYQREEVGIGSAFPVAANNAGVALSPRDRRCGDRWAGVPAAFTDQLLSEQQPHAFVAVLVRGARLARPCAYPRRIAASRPQGVPLQRVCRKRRQRGCPREARKEDNPTKRRLGMGSPRQVVGAVEISASSRVFAFSARIAQALTSRASCTPSDVVGPFGPVETPTAERLRDGFRLGDVVESGGRLGSSTRATAAGTGRPAAQLGPCNGAPPPARGRCSWCSTRVISAASEVAPSSLAERGPCERWGALTTDLVRMAARLGVLAAAGSVA